jgi:hypothetical protein
LGGRVLCGEKFETAVARKAKEELWIEVKKSSFLWSTKIIHQWIPYQPNYFELEIKGEPMIQDVQKHQKITRITPKQSENKVWLAIKINNSIIDDSDQIIRDFHDIHICEKFFPLQLGETNKPPSFLVWMSTSSSLPSDVLLLVNEDIDYFQIFDKRTKEYYILRAKLLENYYKNANKYVVIYKCKGKELLWLGYKSSSYYIEHSSIEQQQKDKIFRVSGWDCITDDDESTLIL